MKGSALNISAEPLSLDKDVLIFYYLMDTYLNTPTMMFKAFWLGISV